MSGDGRAMEPAAPAPYVGLASYDETSAMYFFGREREQRIVTANLLAYPLTVLYGATGVGKSSVLQAGVAHHLRASALADLREGRPPEQVVVVVNSWRDDPLITIRRAVHDALASLYPMALKERDPSGLREALGVWSRRVAGPILIILDQFEEYYLYHADHDGPRTFAEEFPRIVNDVDILVHFVVTIRHDTLAWLDRFKARLPNLLDNYIRIPHLDRAAARRAITGPVEVYNRLRPAARVEVEPQLIEPLLDDLSFGRVDLGIQGGSPGHFEPTAGPARDTIQAPYLQLVLRRLWEAEYAKGSRRLRLVTLRDELGGAGHIVRSHLDVSMQELTAEEQHIATEMFRFLVTPSGTKFAQLLPDLSNFTGISEDKLAPVLGKLANSRIVREAVPASNQPSMASYEIFHDVLAPAILAWSRKPTQEEP